MMLDSVRRLFDCLNSNDIMYCHWKSNEHLEPALNGDTDLDILFCPLDRNKLEVILNECELKRFRATTLSQYNAIEDYIGFDKKEAKIWHLHLHYQLTMGENHLKGYTFGKWGEVVISNRILSEFDVYTSCPEDELILLLTRMSLKYSLGASFSKINEDDLTELSWLKDRVDAEKLYLHGKILVGENCIKMMQNLISNSLKYKHDYSKLACSLRRELRCFTGNNCICSWIKREIRTIFWIIGGVNHRFHRNASKPYCRVSPVGGCVVAFIGTDGAGKSTTIKYIRDELSKKIDVKEVYLGSGEGRSSLLRKPMQMVAKRVGGKGLGHTVESEYQEALAHNKKVSIKAKAYNCAKFLWAMALAREKKDKMREITKARNNGMIVLLDRYPQCKVLGVNDGPLIHDYISSNSSFLQKCALYEENVYEMFEKNPPDLTIRLITSIEVAMERKPEMTYEELNKKRKAVLSMFPSKDIVTIDSSKEKTISFGEAMEQIWKRL